LSVAGEGGAGVAPGVGEEVELTSLKGTVTRAEGGNLYIKPTEVNGQPLGDGMSGMDGDEPDSDDALEAKLKAADPQENYV
jgi:hypothetical protein